MHSRISYSAWSRLFGGTLAAALLTTFACGSSTSSGDGDGDGDSTVGGGDGDSTVGGGDGDSTVGGDGDSTVGGDGDSTVTPVDGACGFTGSYTGPDLGRCVDGKSTATGGYLTIDHFDDMTPGIVASRDGRIGNWWSVNHESATATMTLEATPAGGPTNSVGAIHHVASAGTDPAAWAATLGVDISECYDARAYDGFTFWLRGNPAAGHTQVKLSIHSPPTQPVDTGGACTDGCFDHFAVMVDITDAWVQHRIPWSSFQRIDCTEPTPPVPDGFEPHAMIVGLSYSQPDATAGIDYWVDDLRFFKGTLNDTSTFGDIVTEAIFDEVFPPAGRHPGFTYAGLIEAVTNCVTNAWPVCSSFTTEGNLETRMHEAAAFLAQVAHETGSLMLMEEEACSDGTCQPYLNYYGRGALQLTHDFNYRPAGMAFGVDLISNPDLVATDPKLAWGTALWFWSTDQSSKGICHSAIVEGNFGRTTSIINGIDCGGEKSESRWKLYEIMAHAIGINPHTTNLDCSG